MISVRKSKDRGHANHGWLSSSHSFSFSDYHDPNHMGFHTLRVINEDRIQPNRGFGMHGHQNMEIVSYVVSGALKHKDSMGTGSIIYPGDVQRMSAGSGLRHSEYNASDTEEVYFLQIWILPNRHNIVPSYAQKNFSAEKINNLCCIASPDGRNNSLSIQQNAFIYACDMTKPMLCTHKFSEHRHGWVQVISGSIQLNDHTWLHSGDAASISDNRTLRLRTESQSHFLLFDLV